MRERYRRSPYPNQPPFDGMKELIGDVARLLTPPDAHKEVKVVVSVKANVIIFPWPWPNVSGKLSDSLTTVTNEGLMRELGWKSEEFKIYQATEEGELSGVQFRKRKRRRTPSKKTWQVHEGDSFMAKPTDVLPLNGEKPAEKTR